MNAKYATSRQNHRYVDVLTSAVIGPPVSQVSSWCHTGLLLSHRIEVVTDLLVHTEHVNLGLLKDSMHFLVANDLALVAGILQIISLDVFPKLLDNLRARKLG